MVLLSADVIKFKSAKQLIFGIKSYYNITRGNIKQRAFVKIKFKMMDVAPGNLLHCLSSNIHNWQIFSVKSLSGKILTKENPNFTHLPDIRPLLIIVH